MTIWIALFRGINVGGHHILPMNDLKDLLNGIGCKDVATYVQSGNVAFQHVECNASVLEETISKEIGSRFGFEPRILLLAVDQVISAAERNPFNSAEQNPKTLHLYFLTEEADNPDFATMDAIKSEDEEYALMGRVLYLHAPDGIGRSKLAGRVEKCLGVATTARNWRTVTRLREIAARTGTN